VVGTVRSTGQADAPRESAIEASDAPDESWYHRVRRAWRTRFGIAALAWWWIFRGAPILLTYVALFVANGFAIGWRNAYDVNVAITSPAETRVPVLAWFLSIAGWLAVPVIAGAIAGYVVNASIVGRRQGKIENLFSVDEGS
jgi:hypothetical protein